MSDLQSKYTKLASEYQKLRAQAPVLKKAVIDEQGKAEELKEQIKGKDQTIRKYEQEIDSLTFRNQQLSKRVTVLQDEFEEIQSKGKKKHKNTDSPQAQQSLSSVIGEELQSKIEENARLHKMVFDADQDHKNEMMKVKDRLEVLEREASTHQDIFDGAIQKHISQIEKLQEEKAMLEVKLQTQEREVKEAKFRADRAETQLFEIQRDLNHRLVTATKTIRDKLPFNDTADRNLSALNVPTHDRKHQLQAKELVSQAANHIKELMQGLSNFHTYTGQRSKMYPADGVNEPLSTVNKKFCQFLSENSSYIRNVQIAYQTFHETIKDDALLTLDTATGLAEFGASFKKYVTYVTKLLPYQLLSIEAECEVSSCTSTLQTKNMEVHKAIQVFVNSLTKLETYTSILCSQSSRSCQTPRGSQPRIFRQLATAVADFHEAVRELSKHYNSKVSLEHQLPTISQQLKTTDECIVSSLVSLVTSSGKLSAFISGNLDFFCKLAGYRTRGSSISTNESDEGPRCNPIVSSYRQKAANYLQLISRTCPESVPYKTALHNQRTLLSSTESRDSLAQQVASFHERVSKLEQEKEHWMLEAQLLQIKYEKEMKRVSEFESNAQRTKSGTIEDNIQHSSPARSKAWSTTSNQSAIYVDSNSTLGNLEINTVSDDDTLNREDLIKKHYADRIADLTSQLHLADSKAVNFHAECKALHKRLSIADKSKGRLQTELETVNQLASHLKDELETTTRSYESQLSLMSEHIAGMNDKLAQQKDEIDNLQLQVNTKSKPSKKRGK